jgi:hypothetical protein
MEFLDYKKGKRRVRLAKKRTLKAVYDYQEKIYGMALRKVKEGRR